MIILSILIWIALIVIYIVESTKSHLKSRLFIDKHDRYVIAFKYFLEEAYEAIYKDQILAYSSSGYRPSGEELETIKRNFVKLSRSLMGTNIEKYLIDFYGSEVNLTSNILMFLQAKMDNDELIDFMKRRQQDQEGA